MIGVAASASDLEIAAEFFELFKTPWEPAVAGQKYPVILGTQTSLDHLDADVFLVFSSMAGGFDRVAGVAVQQPGDLDAEWGSTTFPIYGAAALFDSGDAILTAQGKALEYKRQVGTRVVRRVGYDLFWEVRHLLTAGQPVLRASIPTLELHIALLRHLLIDSGVPFVEIPPRPHGFDFTCCLTHDIDFFGVRRHLFDRTMAGFVVRASVGTFVDFARGRRSAVDLVRNLKALCSLPFVFLGRARDFWSPFEDYAQVEDPSRSTFFMVPFRDRPGTGPAGVVDAGRAVRYQVSDVADDARAAVERGSELGVHGIDAWRDATAGRAEKQQLASITNRPPRGVRMHWLYFSGESPQHLERAGFDYDSTWGYNDAIGYRAGTAQVFHLAGTDTLMELPLTIMDSALFAWDRKVLTPEQASIDCRRIVALAKRFGGTLVVNWHCRSLAPERLWRQPYLDLLEDIGREGRAWIVTAAEAVDWFRWRRSIRFSERQSSGGVRVQVSAPRRSTPGGTIRVYRNTTGGTDVETVAFDGTAPYDVDVREHSFSVRSHG